ncbi:hypothetical protein C5Z25_00355 [Lactobacillus sp. CBA3605]|uniref:hypothetical protein n=1 Tax=Lactobacillus sp. CBA3605 TaxID=2099788 RepID=UPI000CFBE835|nr:hypothetical protein [Lactobacillus sp. CBA3605]AVK60320.1 hypothetical protein C5Z25_00355 [Lactobacillus sp. CBA3605]
MLFVSGLGLILLIIGAIFFFIDYAKGTHKKLSYILMAIGLIIAIGGYFGNTYQIKQEQIRQAKIEKNKEKTFASNYSNIRYYTYTTGIKAEKIGDKLTSVWHDAIWNDNGVTVDGKSYTDFNKAIEAQYAVYTSEGTIDKMDTALSHLESTYATLKQNVTNKNETKLADAKKAVKDAKKFVNLVENPSGNYSTFSDNISEADANLSDDL